MTLEKGWLDEQYAKVSADVEQWPDWMQRELCLQPQQHADESTLETSTPPEKTLKAGEAK